MADLYDSDEEELTIENDAVLTKYKTAGEISNLVSVLTCGKIVVDVNIQILIAGKP